jgi:uncharacterized membrane-anchored protein YhcB (DUF1043 family)
LDTISNSLDQVREQARSLYKRIEANNNHAAIRGDLDSLADNLEKLAMDQRDDEKIHLQNAASLVQTSPNDGAELREHMRDALQSISQAVAASRSKSNRRR